MVACYLALIEIGKRWFYRTAPAGPAIRQSFIAGRHHGPRELLAACTALT